MPHVTATVIHNFYQATLPGVQSPRMESLDTLYIPAWKIGLGSAAGYYEWKILDNSWYWTVNGIITE